MERKPLSLRVLRVNAAARRIYACLGFAVTRSTGDHDYLKHHSPIVDSRVTPQDLWRRVASGVSCCELIADNSFRNEFEIARNFRECAKNILT